MTRPFQIQVSENIGSVSAVWVEPDPIEAVLVLAHGAGAGMNHSFMESLAGGLSKCGIGTLLYNFPYMENKKGRPDPPAIAHKTVEAAIAAAYARHPHLPLFAGGKSFGGRMTSQRLAKDNPAYLKGIVFYGFPLHPLGAPSTDRADHLNQVQVPMLFLQGTKDKMAELPLLDKVCKDLPLATLHLLEGADHSFKSGKKQLIPVLAAETKQWMSGIIRHNP